MNINPNFYISIFLFLFLFWLSDRGFSKKSINTPQKTILGFCVLLAAISLSIPMAYLSDAIGAHPNYAQFRALPYTEILVVLSAPLLAYIANKLKTFNNNFVMPWLLLCLGLFYIGLPFIKPIIRPLHISMAAQWQDGIALQSTPSTCGPASLLTIFRQYGVTDTESHIAQQAFTSRSGTENWYLARYAKTQGLDYQFLHIPHLQDVPPVSIIGVKLGKAGHYITLLDNQNGVYTIADSLNGIHRFSLVEFEKHYAYTGFVLQLTPK